MASHPKTMRGPTCRTPRRIPATDVTRDGATTAEDLLEPPIVGEDGYAYLRLYEITGNTRYLEESIRCATALARNYAPGT